MKRNTHIQVMVFLSVFFSMLLSAMPVRAGFLNSKFMKSYALRMEIRAKREVLSITDDINRLKREYKRNPSASIQSQIDSLEAKLKEAKKDVAYWNDVYISYTPYKITTDTIVDGGRLLGTDIVIPLKGGELLGLNFSSRGKDKWPVLNFVISSNSPNSAISSWVYKQLESGSTTEDGFTSKTIESQTIKVYMQDNVLTNSAAFISPAKSLKLSSSIGLVASLYEYKFSLNPFTMKESLGKAEEITKDKTNYLYGVGICCPMQDFRSNKTNENSFAYLRQLFETRNITKIEFYGFEFYIDSGQRIAYTLKEMFERIYGKSAEE